MVIDTYELHSKINIPNVDFVNCYFDKDINTRVSVYQLNDEINMDNFKYVDKNIEKLLQGSKLLKAEELPTGENIYLASGSRWGTNWTMIVDKESNRLWAELTY